jgi:hypothetical protein
MCKRSSHSRLQVSEARLRSAGELQHGWCIPPPPIPMQTDVLYNMLESCIQERRLHRQVAKQQSTQQAG